MSNTRETKILIAVSLSTTTLAVPATASPFDLFDSRADWTAATSGPLTIEGFEGRNTPGPIGGFPSFFNSGLGLSVTGQASVTSAVESGDPFFQGLQNTTPGGENYARLGVGGTQGDYTARFLLPQPVNAFGFDIIDWEPGRITSGLQGASVELRNNTEVVFGFDLASDLDENGAVAFIGFISDTFTWDEIRFTINENEQPVTGDPALDVVGLDEVAWVVPAPGAVAPIALACLAIRRRRG